MRIVGIKLYGGYDCVVKNLKPGWYPFGNYQEPTGENNWQWRTDNQRMNEEYCNRLYKSVAGDEPFSPGFELTVNSIVGKNGSGKTTLLEIYFRIINNLSYRLFDKAWGDAQPKKNPQLGHELHYAEGLKATLFFETDGNLGMIDCDYKKMKYCIVGKEEQTILLPTTKYITTRRLKKLMQPFFYTICSNYSIYSLNEETYISLLRDHSGEENKEWIGGILHKNDGYLAPIVMVPYREEGEYIDVNKENLLANQRLSTLALLFLSQNKPFMAGYEPVKMKYVFRLGAEHYYRTKIDQLSKDFLAKDGKKVEKGLRDAWEVELVKQEKYIKKPEIVKQAIMNYMVYKTMKVCLTYRDFGVMLGLSRPNNKELETFDERIRKKIFYAELPEGFGQNVVERIVKEEVPSHITLKLHQMLEYIKRDFLKADDPKRVIDLDNPFDIREEKDLKGFLAKNMAYDNENKFKDKKRKRYESYDDVFVLTPPAIFDWEILFRKKDDPEVAALVRIDEMSSGEKQLMHSFSYILYHIKNLQSVKDTMQHIPYHHVSLIFDEAELYYHPEFQRDFISKIIQMLAWCHIDSRRIRSVNITVVTHSPFVLSDVMVENTLNMKGGDVQKKKHQTFGANIHDLLYDQFIDDSIGAVVRKAVCTISDLYQRREEVEAQKQLLGGYDYYYFLASSISEPYIRKNLLEMLTKMKAETVNNSDSLESLSRERELLSHRIQEIDQEIEKRKKR